MYARMTHVCTICYVYPYYRNLPVRYAYSYVVRLYKTNYRVGMLML